MSKRWLLLLAAAAIAVSAALVNASGSGARTADVPTTNVYAWIGLKNSDDVGTRFDVKAEVTNGASEGYGTALNVSGGSSGFNNAKLVTIPVTNYVGTVGQAVSVTIWVRVACQSGHASGTARLWWNDAQANSKVNESPGFGDLYLAGTNTLSPSAGSGPKKTSDVLVKKSGCPNQPDGNWKTFGTWTADIDLSLDLTMDLTSDLNGNGSLTIGDRVSFTLTLDNAGINTAANVHVADLLPPGYHFFSSFASQGTYSGVTADWNVGAVSVPSTPTLQIVATVIGGQSVSAYTNYAQVSSAGGFDPDSTPANNSTTEDDDASVTPPIADLSVTKAVALAPGGDLDGSSSLTVGDRVVFTVTVSNAGPDPAPNVLLVDLLANGFTYVGDDSLGAYDAVTGQWVVGTVASATTKTLHITATVNPSGPYTNTAQVTQMGYGPPPSGINLYLDPDSTPNNNVPSEDDQATVTPTVQPST
jgi:uncharacterized repeat protein (TIGR01451 family)